jgi:hypothetical protein
MRSWCVSACRREHRSRRRILEMGRFLRLASLASPLFNSSRPTVAAQADRLDPLVESPASVLDRKAEVIEERMTWYGYGYQKPEPPFQTT